MGTAPRSVNIVTHYHLFFTDSHIRRCNDGGLVPEEEGGGEEARSKGCRPPILQEVHLPLHQEADPSRPAHLFTDLVSFGSRHLVLVYQLELLPAGVHASFHTLATTFLISQGMGTGGQVEHVWGSPSRHARTKSTHGR